MGTYDPRKYYWQCVDSRCDAEWYSDNPEDWTCPKCGLERCAESWHPREFDAFTNALKEGSKALHPRYYRVDFDEETFYLLQRLLDYSVERLEENVYRKISNHNFEDDVVPGRQLTEDLHYIHKMQKR